MGTVNGPTFVVTFCATPGANDANAIRALRAVLKFALRRFNLKCVDAREIPIKQLRRITRQGRRRQRNVAPPKWRELMADEFTNFDESEETQRKAAAKGGSGAAHERRRRRSAPRSWRRSAARRATSCRKRASWSGSR